MRKLIAALVLGVMACSSANAMKTYRWIDEDGIEQVVHEMDEWDTRSNGTYYASGKSSHPEQKKHDIHIRKNGNITTFQDTETGEYTVCTQDPYDNSMNCH